MKSLHSLALLFLAIAPLVHLSARAQSSTAPELPRIYVDTTYTVPSARTIAVAAGGNLPAALNAARPGDVITLEAGATFTGPFTLPDKPGSGWITIRTSTRTAAFRHPGRASIPRTLT